MEYTQEIFIKNFIEDRKILGEDAQYIYEEIFSSISGEEISLNEFVNDLDENYYAYENSIFNETQNRLNRQLTEEEESELREKIIAEFIGPLTQAEAAKAAAAQAAASQFGKVTPKLGFWTRLKNGFSGILDKVNFKGRSLKDILAGGLGWLKNPANLSKILTTAGGVALVTIIMRALKKRKRMKEYRQLQQAKENLSEGYEDEFSWGTPGGSDFAKAKNELTKECETNKALHDIVYGKKIIKQNNYFDY